jgi:hypothetical protein
MQFRVWPLLFVAACAPAADNLILPIDESSAQTTDAPPWPVYHGPSYFPASLGEPTIVCDYDGRSQPILSDFERAWYSRQLAAAREPSLYGASQGSTPPTAATLRFTWLRSFHAPVVVRIETIGPTNHRLIAKQLSGAGGYDPGEVSRTVERPLTSDEAGRLRSVVARASVFDIPPDPCGGGCDGAQWIFEAVEGRDYRFVSLWTPRRGPARDLGELLMKFTGWDFEWIY